MADCSSSKINKTIFLILIAPIRRNQFVSVMLGKIQHHIKTNIFYRNTCCFQFLFLSLWLNSNLKQIDMKKYSIMLAMFFISHMVFAQNHIEFMGIPLGQELHLFIFKLEQKGFRGDEWSNTMWNSLRKDKGQTEEYNWYIMKGKYLGVNNQDIGIHYTDDKIVNTICISFNYKSWNAAFNQYSKLKSMLTQKYGKPNKCIESFSNPKPKDDRGKTKALYSKKGKYSSIFKVKSGYIELSILCVSNNEPYVDLRYKDSIKEREPIDDL